MWPLLKCRSNNHYLFWVCICSLSFPERKEHVLYYIAICDLSGSKIFFHVMPLKVRFSEKKLMQYKICVLICCKPLVWNISHFQKKWSWYYHNRKNVFTQSTRYSYQILLKFVFSLQSSKNTRITYFVKIRSVEAEFSHADGKRNRQTDRHNEANSRFMKFCKRT